jgi:tRNA(Ile)-lysidine synthase
MTSLFEKKLLDEIKGFRNKKILVAFSGGADSTALLYALYKNNYNIIACHVNHSLRGSFAERDEKFCIDFCSRYKIELITKKVNVPEYVKNMNVSVEEAARKLRYEQLIDTFNVSGSDFLFTAHHLDDLVETFFIKIFQGSSIYNLKGFDMYKDFLKRPMLGIEKSLILEFIESENIEYVTDETNFSCDYLRNWLRGNIIPHIASYNKGFIKNIVKIQDESANLKSYLLNRTKDVKLHDMGFFFYGELRKITALELFEQKFVLSEFLKRFFRVQKVHLENILNIINSKGDSVRINLPKDCIFEKSYDKIYFFKKSVLKGFEYIKEKDEDSLEIREINKIILFSGELVKERLVVRSRRHGDRFLGKKLKDLFIDKKIELFLRDTSCIVESFGKIIYVEMVSENKNIKIQPLKQE